MNDNSLYIPAYYQSKFGKLKEMAVPEMMDHAVESVCAVAGTDASAIDVGSIGSACGMTLNGQGLMSGLMAMHPGLSGKSIETVENACASGGQAIISVATKLLAGLGDVGIVVGLEKMRDDVGKMDGQKVGQALGYFSHPQDREGKTYIFPHIFAEVMELYMETHGVSEEDLAAIAVTEYANAQFNPYAQMRGTTPNVDQVMAIEGFNRYIVDGLPLKTYDCSQITDGYAALILATEKGLEKLDIAKSDCVELAGFAQATDPLARHGRNVLRPAGAYRAMRKAYDMAGVKADDVDVAEIHDCFTVMGAIGVEVLGKAEYGEGARYWNECKTRTECWVNSSGGLIAKGHPVGATGVAMVGWCVWQLLCKAPLALQHKAPRVAATFNIGGPICASVCTVLKPAA